MKRKTLLMILITIVLVLAAGARGFWWLTQQPLYQPGKTCAAR
jgi:flagellar basal body-associated protein FliL